MKSSKLIFLISMLAISLVVINIIIPTNSNVENKVNRDSLKTSKISERIHINGNLDWINFKNAGNCTGSGTYSDPYIIENLEIDGEGLGNCIFIENSTVYFKVENCTLFNSGYPYAGIFLSHVNNSQLIENDCSDNSKGIMLEYCNNNTILGNIANNNENYGIYLDGRCYHNNISENIANNNDFGIYLYISSNNTVRGNSINNNIVYGIYVLKSEQNEITGNYLNDNKYGIDINDFSYNNSFSGNLMYNCCFRFFGNTHTHDSQYIDTTNLVNDKLVHYYTYEVDLTSTNFTNGGQVILIQCSNSSISNLNLYNTYLYYCNNITIQHNEIANNNIIYGIEFQGCWNNTISENIIKDHYQGIFISRGHSNFILDNNITGSAAIGIKLSRSDNNVIRGNRGNECLHMFDSENNDIIENTFNNSYYGILVDVCISNTIMGNILCDNSDYGILMHDSNNNFVIGNSINNNGRGIYMHESNNNFVTGNSVNNNRWHGIYLYDSDSNNISNNTVKENEIGIDLYHSNHTGVFENSIQKCDYGMYIHDSHNNSIFQNSFNNSGIRLNGTYEQLISHDIDQLNTVNGRFIYYYINETNLNPSNFSNCGQIFLIGCNDSILAKLNLTANSLGISLYYCHNNTLYENRIINEICGLYLHFSSDNLFYNNSFIQNSRNAYAFQSNNNYFNNSVIGNYWSDYNGFDLNGDGIGETPYISGGIIDNLPICNRFDIYAPNITILEPLNFQEYRGELPHYSIVIEEYMLDNLWYTIDGGQNNFTITSYTGDIDQDRWEILPFGRVTLIFYAKDMAGNIGSAEVTIIKKSSVIPGYNLIVILGVIGLISLSMIKRRFQKLD